MSIEQYRLELQAEQARKELAPKEETVQDVTTSEEVETESLESEAEPEREYTEVERDQMERGWDPNHPDGVSAKEFKRVGEIIEAKRRASKEAQIKSKEVEELTTTVKQLVEHNKAMALAAMEAKNRDLASRKMEKIQEGDVEAVLAIEQEQKRYEAAARLEQAVPAPVVEDSEDVRAFKTKYNQYLNGTSPEDKRIQSIVKSQVEFFMQTDPNVDEKVAIAEIESTLAKVFPEKFAAEPKSKVSKVAVSTTSGRGKSVPEMTLEDKYLFESIRTVDKTFTVDQFADMYLKKRK